MRSAGHAPWRRAKDSNLPRDWQSLTEEKIRNRVQQGGFSSDEVLGD